MASQLESKLAVAGKDQGGVPTIAQLIKAQEHEIARALPANGVTPERFSRIVLTELRKTPALAQCEPASLLGSMMVAASLGLEIGGHLGHAYLLPFKRQVTLVIGYRGYLELARRSGTISSIVARAVHEQDEFSYSYGLDDTLVHAPALGDRGPAIAYYGVAKYRDGGHYLLVMSKADIDKRRARSKASASGPWVTDYDAMACKTVIRTMAPFLPLTAEVQRAVSLDESRGPSTIDFDLDEVALDNADIEDAEIVDPPADASGELPLDPGRPFDEAS